MTIEQMKSIINSIEIDLRAKYGIDWLDYTLQWQQANMGFYRCDIFASKNSEIKTDYVYIRIDTNEDMVKRAFDTALNHIVVMGWGK